jgi:hypothetical protein
MNYTSIISGLYYLLIYADGSVNDKEITSIKQMVKAEGLNEAEFMVQMRMLQSKDKDMLLADCMMALKKLGHEQQGARSSLVVCGGECRRIYGAYGMAIDL